MGWHDAGLVVDAEEGAEEGVEEDPACYPGFGEAGWDFDGGEEEGDCGEEEAGFLVLEAGEGGDAGYGGPEEGVLSAGEEE